MVTLANKKFAVIMRHKIVDFFPSFHFIAIKIPKKQAAFPRAYFLGIILCCLFLLLIFYRTLAKKSCVRFNCGLLNKSAGLPCSITMPSSIKNTRSLTSRAKPIS